MVCMSYLLTINLKKKSKILGDVQHKGVYYVWLRLAQGHGNRSIKKILLPQFSKWRGFCLENQHLYLWYFSSGIAADINLCLNRIFFSFWFDSVHSFVLLSYVWHKIIIIVGLLWESNSQPLNWYGGEELIKHCYIVDALLIWETSLIKALRWQVLKHLCYIFCLHFQTLY